MTTLAYRDGVLAGDSLITSDGKRVGSMTKIARRSDGALCGVAGCASHIRAVLAWFLDGETPDDRPVIKDGDASFIIVRANGKVESHDERGFSDDTAPFHALGSGRDVAMGAMATGSTAIDAVKIAAKIDLCTGGPIRWVARKGKRK